MSRIGNNPINIPEGVSIDIQPEKISIKGKLGELTQSYNAVEFEIEDSFLRVKRSRIRKMIKLNMVCIAH